MTEICERHNQYLYLLRFGDENVATLACEFCKQEDYWTKYGKRWSFCIEHKRPYLNGCQKCGQLAAHRRRNPPKMANEIQEKYRQSMIDAQITRKHVNEICASCDRPISFDEWFCYCQLCPDCYLNSEEEIDNYLGTK